MTWCEECRQAELTPWQRAIERLFYQRGNSTARVIRDFGMSMAGIVRAMDGRVTSSYDRHIADFIRTGNDLDLVRALRHVSLDIEPRVE